MSYLHALVSYLRLRQRYLWGTYKAKRTLNQIWLFSQQTSLARNLTACKLRLCTITATYLESVLEIDVFVTFVANLFRLAIT